MLKQVQHDGGNSHEPEANRQIQPRWIILLDEVELPLAVPAFELLFSRDRGWHILEQLEANKTMDRVTRGESIRGAVAMLMKPPREIGSNTNIERAVPPTGENVDTGLPIHRTASC